MQACTVHETDWETAGVARRARTRETSSGRAVQAETRGSSRSQSRVA